MMSVYEKSYRKNLTLDEALDFINYNKSYIIDVRSRQEYNEGHMKNSINIPLYDLKSKIRNVVPNLESYIFVYCKNGSRSKKAENLLYALGYINVYNLTNLYGF